MAYNSLILAIIGIIVTFLIIRFIFKSLKFIIKLTIFFVIVGSLFYYIPGLWDDAMILVGLEQPIVEEPEPTFLSWRGLIPGNSTKEEVLNVIGGPASSEVNGDIEILYFESDGGKRYAEIKEGMLNTIQVPLEADEQSFDSIKQKYGGEYEESSAVEIADGQEVNIEEIYYKEKGVKFISKTGKITKTLITSE